MPTISIFAFESQPIVIEGLERVLGAHADLYFAGSCAVIADALEAVRARQPDVLLVDQGPGLKTALQFMADLKGVSPHSQPILWVQELAEVECFRALQMGARGVLKKSLPVTALLDCIRAVARGSVWVENSISDQVIGYFNRRNTPRLTPREREIVRFICRGMKNKEIAESLSITAGTVKVHLMHIFEKTGVKDRFELAVHGRKLAGELDDIHPAAHGSV